jgi:hypothetical protein
LEWPARASLRFPPFFRTYTLRYNLPTNIYTPFEFPRISLHLRKSFVGWPSYVRSRRKRTPLIQCVVCCVPTVLYSVCTLYPNHWTDTYAAESHDFTRQQSDQICSTVPNRLAHSTKANRSHKFICRNKLFSGRVIRFQNPLTLRLEVFHHWNRNKLLLESIEKSILEVTDWLIKFKQQSDLKKSVHVAAEAVSLARTEPQGTGFAPQQRIMGLVAYTKNVLPFWIFLKHRCQGSSLPGFRLQLARFAF